MGLIDSGIEQVRAFALAAGVSTDGSAVNEPLSALVRWRSEHTDKLHQVYVNGEPAGVTTDTEQRSIIIPIRSCWGSAARLEVFAVEPAEANIDFGSELQSAPQVGRVEISWPRRMYLPFEGIAEVFSDGGSGQVDYDNPVTKEPIQLWPNRQESCGLGLSRFGESDFGYDGSAAVGFGVGCFGEGEFGFDADKISWESGELQTGEYEFAVKITDRFGKTSDAQQTGMVTVIRQAEPAIGLDVDSYDKQENELVLSLV